MGSSFETLAPPHSCRRPAPGRCGPVRMSGLSPHTTLPPEQLTSGRQACRREHSPCREGARLPPRSGDPLRAGAAPRGRSRRCCCASSAPHQSPGLPGPWGPRRARGQRTKAGPTPAAADGRPTPLHRRQPTVHHLEEGAPPPACCCGRPRPAQRGGGPDATPLILGP